MLRMFLGENGKLLNSIVSKMITKCLRKNFGCKSAKVTAKDFVVYRLEGDKLLIHLNGDLEISKEELLSLINDKIGENE